jgi:hypothetical protein
MFARISDHKDMVMVLEDVEVQDTGYLTRCSANSEYTPTPSESHEDGF